MNYFIRKKERSIKYLSLSKLFQRSVGEILAEIQVWGSGLVFVFSKVRSTARRARTPTEGARTAQIPLENQQVFIIHVI